MFSFCFIVSLVVTHLFRVSVLCIEEFWLDWAYSRDPHTVWQRQAPQEGPFDRQWRSLQFCLSVSFSHSRCLLFFLSDDEKNWGWRFHKSTVMVQFFFTVSLGDCHLNLIPGWGRTLFFLQENEKNGNNLIIQEVTRGLLVDVVITPYSSNNIFLLWWSIWI